MSYKELKHKEDLKRMDKIIKTDKAQSMINNARKSKNTGYKNWIEKLKKGETNYQKKVKKFRKEE